jgi:protein gp37
MAKRLKAMHSSRYANGFEVTLHPEALDEPYGWKKPRTVFVNSMSDLFHPAVPFEFIERIFETMINTPRHNYQILTKRSDRLADLAPKLTWPANVWMGVSVEDERVVNRIDDLRKVNAAVRFLSLEPLIGPLYDLNLKDIDWVIVGGESGPKSRPMEKDWVESLRIQCEEAEVSFFFKQWGGVRKHVTGRELNGNLYNEMPGDVERNSYIPIELAMA